MSDPSLRFIANPSNEGEGLSDAGVETFRDRPYFSVAREAGQNSRDARADVTRPVKMVFREHLIDTKDFPSHDEYLKVIDLCLNKSTLSEKEKSFFVNAKQLLSKSYVKVLEISDSNTSISGCPSNKIADNPTSLSFFSESYKPTPSETNPIFSPASLSDGGELTIIS